MEEVREGDLVLAWLRVPSNLDGIGLLFNNKPLQALSAGFCHLLTTPQVAFLLQPSRPGGTRSRAFVLSLGAVQREKVVLFPFLFLFPDGYR